MTEQNPLPRILVVDESRMIRAMLVRQIREFYDFREEADGESAWQVLVLDHSVTLVICSLSLPVLDGDGLLARVRASRLERLAQMPMLMISGDDEQVIERARSHGASDFIRRGTGGAELLARVDSLVRLSQARHQLKESLAHQVQNPETGLFTRKYIELQALQAMSQAMRHNSEVSVLVIGFDNVGTLRDEHGQDVLKQLQQRFIAVLSGRIRREDSLGHYQGSQLVVLSPGTSRAACEAFGDRVRKAVQAASITIHGQRVVLTVSIGISNSPADEVTSAGALIELASSRLKSAQQAGGNCVVTGRADGEPLSSMAVSTLTVDQSLDLLRRGEEKVVVPHLDKLGEKLLPLLRLLEQEMALGLRPGDIERRLLKRSAPDRSGPEFAEVRKHID